MSEAATEGTVTPLKRAARPAPKPSQKKATAPAAKKAPAAKAPAAKKAAPPAKKAASGVARTASTISKEGTQKCSFSGEVLPVTQFPTVKQADGSYARGTVARKHLAAFRAAKKAEREAAKAAAASKKATAAKAK
jgi:hypothetical protein